MEKWPTLNDPKFYEMIDDYFTGKTGEYNYTLTPIDVSLGHSCNKDVKLTDLYDYQKFVAEYMSPGHPYRGLLLYHGLGSGKTLSSIGVINQYITKEPNRQIIAITPPGIKVNIAKELHNAYTTIFNKGKTGPALSRYLNEKIRVISYIEIANRLKGITSDNLIKKDTDKKPALDNTLIIIDEAHNIVDLNSPYKKSFEIIRKAITRSNNIKILLMTATPIKNKPYEIGMLINLLKTKDGYRLPETENEFNKEFIDEDEIGIKKIINKDKLLRAFKGLVSYYGGSEFDTSKFARKEIQPIVEAEMSDYQYEQWRKARKGEEKKKESDDFEFNSSRKASDYPTGNCYDTEKSKGTSRNINTTVQDLDKYSMKLKMLTNNLNSEKFNGKHFVYSYYKSNGVNTIIAALKYQGWKEYTRKDLKKLPKIKVGVDKFEPDISKLPKQKAFISLIGDLSQNDKNLVIDSFNSVHNVDSTRIKVLVADRQYKEGVSLMDTNYVHVFEPAMSISDFDQIVARAIRNCSHVRLPYPEKWFVKAFTYFSKKSVRIDESRDQTTDYIIGNIAESRFHLKNQFLKIMKEVAIDCITNKARNEKDIICHRPVSHKKIINNKPNISKNFQKMQEPRNQVKCNILNKKNCIDNQWCYYKNDECLKKPIDDIPCNEFDNSDLDCMRREDCIYKDEKCINKFTDKFAIHTNLIEFEGLFEENEKNIFELQDNTEIKLRVISDDIIQEIDNCNSSNQMINIIKKIKNIAINYPLRLNFFDIDDYIKEFKLAKPEIWNENVNIEYQYFIEKLIDIKNNPDSYLLSAAGTYYYYHKFDELINLDDIKNKQKFINYMIKLTPNLESYYISSDNSEKDMINLNNIENYKENIIFELKSAGTLTKVKFNLAGFNLYSVEIEFNRDPSKQNKKKYRINELDNIWHI